MKATLHEERQCDTCRKPYSARRIHQRFCSVACKSAHNNVRSASSFAGKNLSTGTIGAIGELVVAAELMKDGWEVFRALSPSSSCDLAAIKDGKLYRFEVRTGFEYANGRICHRKHSNAENMLVVTYPTKLHFFPDPPQPAIQ